MLTSAMPSVVKALSGVLPPVALKQLTQALGNCNQTVTQRGDVVMQPDAWMNANNNNGTYGGDTWNFNDYQNLLQNIDARNLIDIAGDTYNANYGDQFFDNSVRNSYGGDTVFFGGDTITIAGDTISNSYGGNTTNTIDQSTYYGDVTTTVGGITQNFYNGPPGPPGSPGASGQNGSNGRDGRGGIGLQGPAGAAGNPGAAGGNGADGRDGSDGVDGITEVIFTGLGPPQRKFVVDDIQVQKARYSVVVDVTFDPETCALTVDKVDLPEVVTNVTERKYTLKYYGPVNGLG